MARCTKCSAEFEGARQESCPVCGAPRPRPVLRTPPPITPDPPPSRVHPPSVRPDPGPTYEHASEFVRISSPRPAPVPRSTEIGAPVAGGCSVCGRTPAVELSLRRHIGLIIIMRFATVKALFCREHGIAAASEYLRRTLVEGWWGFLSFFLNFIAIFQDMHALRIARRLAPPVGVAMPIGAATPAAPALPVEMVAALAESGEDRAERRSVLVTVLVSIGLGVVVLVVTLVTNDPSATVTQRLSIGLGLIVGLYVAVALLVRRRLGAGRTRPFFAEGDGRAIGVGVGVGALGGLLAVGVNSLVAGKLSSDPNMVLVLFERQWIIVFVLMGISTIAAPLVEEYLFRGLLVESLRSRGRTSAVLGGAVAFAFWHLNPAQLRYYVLMGFLLGYLYWRFGLNGSIAAHAVFNGMLVAFAFGAVSGSPQAVSVEGATLQLPPGWDLVDEGLPIAAPVAFDIVAEAPSGSAVLVQHVVGPAPQAGTPLPADPMALVPPGAQSARRVPIAEGTGVRFTIRDPVTGLPAENVIAMRGNRAYFLTFVSGGSKRAEQQFEQMLATLQLSSF